MIVAELFGPTPPPCYNCTGDRFMAITKEDLRDFAHFANQKLENGLVFHDD
jgi:hypothetical protein